ncbi:MAG: clostripain-related cysteine peptidase [Exilispira sp.]|jgi:hypothetical protein|nr:clostripain-related cysteine peptidase [Exilispira sp.]
MKKTLFAIFVLLFFVALFACQSPINLTDDIGNGVDKAPQYVENTRLNMTSKDAYEEDDSTTYAKTITVNSTAQEHNFYDDANDYLKFSATSGTTYTIETVVYGVADTVLYLLDGSTTLASNDDKGDGTYGSKITWTAPSTKTYYIRVYSYNGKKGTNRGYTISLTSGSGGGGGGITLPQPKKSWTILVYLDADNNLSSYGDYDINEMKTVGSDSNINIVVLWDNAGSIHGYYYVQTTGATLLQDVGEVNMGSETTAKNFIDFATSNFPADHYMWVFWNHGGAVDRSFAPKGVCWDDTNSSDHLTEVEQKSIISYLNSKTGKTLDVLAYDACLMACAELFYQFRGMVSYIASSEQTIPGNGYDYEFISYIKNNPSTTAYYAAKAIFDYYKAEYSTTSDVTFSVVNVSYASNLGTAINNFATAAINSGISGTTFKNLKPTNNFSGYTWDLYVYMSNIYNSSSMTTTIKNYAKAIMDLVNPANAQLVPLEWHGSTWTSKAYGVAITLKADTTTYRLLDICADTQWNEFLTFAGF